MTARDILNQIRVLQIKIEAMQEQYDRLKSKAESIKAISYETKEGSKGSSSSGGYTTENTIIDYITLEEEIEKQKVLYEKKRQILIDMICCLDNPKYIELLMKRYVELKPFGRIAKEMQYSYDRIKHMHMEALNEFDKVSTF